MKMRKILSFVLVLSLVLGSFSMAFAATPSDVVGTPNAEAVEVLMGLGVVNGYPDGTYKPENIVTRAEMAKLIVVALGLSDYATGTSKYPDMAGATWAQGYVNYATGLGIIKGYPDGTFKPSATVSYDEASAMIVRALGYTDASLLPATWPANYVVKAKALGVLDGVKASALGANRGDIAEMLYNALTLDIGTVDADNKWNANDTTVAGTNPDNFLVRLGAKFHTADVVYGTEETMINLVPYVGTYAETYTIDDEIVAVAVASDSITGDYITASGIINASTDDDKDYTVSADAKTEKVPVFWNGVAEYGGTTKFAIDAVTMATGHKEYAVDLSGKRVDELYAISYWQVSESGLFDSDVADEIADDSILGVDFILDDNDEIDHNQFILEGVKSLSDIKKDNVVYVYDGWHEAGVKKIQVGTEVVTGKVTEKDGTTYTINGKEYDLAVYEVPNHTGFNGETIVTPGNIAAPDTFKVGDTITARLDYYGNIFDVEVDSSTPDTYAIVKATADNAIDGVRVKLYTSADVTKTFGVDDDATLEGKALALTAGGLVGYGLDKDGIIDSLDVDVTTAAAATLSSVTVLKADNKTYAVAKDVVVFTKAGNEYDVTTIGKVETGKELTGAADLQMILDDDNYVVAIVVDAASAGATDDDTYAVVNKVVTAIDANDDPIQKITGFAAGSAITKYTDGDVIAFSDAVIALWNLEVDADGVVTKATQATTDAAVYKTTTISALNTDKTAVQVGNTWYALADDVVVYEVKDDGGYEYSVATKTTLKVGYKISLFETDPDNDGYEVVIFEK